MGRRRRRILVSAYLFSPVMGSEQGVGWNICSRLAAYHDVTVLTRSWNEELWAGDEKHREDAERFMQDRGPIPGLTIQFVELTTAVTAATAASASQLAIAIPLSGLCRLAASSLPRGRPAASRIAL